MKRALLAALICLCAAGSQAQTRRAPQTRGTARPSPAAPSPTPAPKPSPSPSPAAAAAVADECGCEPQALPEVLAVVNGVRVTRADISPGVQAQIDELKKQVVQARERELDLQINSLLLDAEAKKRGTTSVKLIEQEIVAKAKEPTEAEAQAFFEQNKSRIEAQAGRAVTLAEVRDNVLGYLREQRQQEAAKAFAERLRAAAAVKVNVAKPTPPATPADRARVLATVNGAPLTSGDIEDSLKPLIGNVQESIYALRKREVDLKINDVLLEEEARKRSVTTTALLDAEVNSKVPTVTEADARKFFDENKARINGDFPAVKYQIIKYLEDQAKHKANQVLAQRLRNGASVQTFIRKPEPMVFNIATDDQPTKGNPSASVTLVEFTDYQCPSCAQTQPVIERIAAEYADRVRVVVRDFPLSIHENAFKAAEAAEAAREQGKYWEYVALLFRNQSSLATENLRQYAVAAGLDIARFDAALSSGKFAGNVQRDMLDGQKLGVNSTPTIFINGRLVTDRSYEGLKLVIDDALRAAPKK